MSQVHLMVHEALFECNSKHLHRSSSVASNEIYELLHSKFLSFKL